MKVTRKQLRNLVRKTLKSDLREQYEPREPSLPNPEDHDFTGPIGDGNILRKWICMSGIPGGEGEEQWGWMRIQPNKKIKFGNWGDQSVVSISQLEIESRVDKSFNEDEIRVYGFKRGRNGKLYVSGEVNMGRLLGGWQGVEPGTWKRVDAPDANSVIRSILTQLYRHEEASVELERHDVPVVGDVTITLSVA